MVLLACPQEKPARLDGDGWSLAVDGSRFLYRRDAQTLVTLPFDAFVVGTVGELDDGLSYDPYWLFIDDGIFSPTTPPGFAWRTPTEGAIARDGDAYVLTLTYPRGLTATVRAEKGPAGNVRFTFIPSGAAVAMLRVKLGADADEAFYGLGEWFDGLNHRGKVRPLQLEAELNVESSTTENHVTTPFLIGSRGWGVFFESRRHGLVDVAKTSANVVDAMFGTAEQSASGLVFHFFSSAKPLEIVTQYYRVTGFPALPAEWATGPWIWRNESANQAEVEDDVRQLRALDLATSAIWIDRPYATDVNTFDFDPARYADAGAMISTIHAAGLRLALWHTPYLAPGAEPLRSLAVDAGYFPVVQGTQLNTWGPPLDVTVPEATAFWRSNLARYIDLGVEGFKLDFAEDIAAGLGGARSGWTFHDGSTDRTMADGYIRGYHAMYRRALAANPGFLLVRHAQWGEQATAGLIIWPGDIDATLTRWKETFTDRGGDSHVGVGGLPSAIRAGIGLAASGFPLFAADTGGYRESPPNKETFMRWVQQSALMPVMQTGDSSSQPPWVFTAQNGRDAEALETYRSYARLHLRLFPFFWTLMSDPQALPVVRAFGLQFPELKQHPEDQYLLGDSLLVTPIETAGATSRTLVIPPGDWFDFDTGAQLTSPTVDAPLTKLPLFLREGALIAMLAPDVDTLAPATDADVRSFANDAGVLWVRVQPGEGSVTLFDGTALSQTASTLHASAGTRFTTSVVWEFIGVPVGTVTHGGTALAIVTDLDAVTSGVLVEGARALIKTPLDGQATVWR